MTGLHLPRIALAFTPLALVLWASAGCQSSPGTSTGGAGTGGAGTGGAAGDGGSSNGQAGADAGDGRGDANAEETFDPAAACVEKREPLRQSGGTLALAIEPRLAGKPFVFGEPNVLPSGGTVTPLNFRFYVSHVALLKAAGAPVPVDLVTASGALEPYGVHLFNAEDLASQTLRVLAPPGEYTGVAFVLGLDDACNSGMAGMRQPPLTASSQMVWPLAGYLFLRYEGLVSAVTATAVDGGSDAAPDAGGDVAMNADAATPSDARPDGGDPAADAAIPSAIHMGGFPHVVFAPTVEARGGLSISASQATARSLRLDMGAVFEGATTPAASTSTAGVPLPPGPEVQAGERLRQHAPQLPLFVLAP